jgi:two-component system, NtrC family, nitrogen regulation response regulator NtrX
MTGASILVVDDESGIRSTITEILSDEGYSVLAAANAEEASNLYKSEPVDLVLLDIWMPDMDGISLLKKWSESRRLKCPVVIMSGHGTVETAVEATRLGAVDYIEKPLSLAQLLRTVESALRQRVETAAETVRPADRLHGLEIPQGKSALMESAREQALVIAAQKIPVLITGEAGSGRTAFARYIHASGSRASRPFIRVDGALLNDSNALDLFVGTSPSQPGLFLQAEAGTLFINDLQELGPRAQSLLLGFLEHGSVFPAGSAEARKIDVRCIATVQPRSGEKLRADLLAAIGVMHLNIPPLRDRNEDVPGLLKQYVDRLMDKEGLPYRRFNFAAQNRLRNYPWPGNLRELHSLVRRLLLAGGSEEIGLQEVESNLAPPMEASGPLVSQDLLALPMREAREQFERAYLSQQLALCGGKVGKLADRVKMERTHLYRKLRSLGIDFRQGGLDD